MSKDFDKIKEEFENLKNEILLEFRVSRTSDIANSTKLKNNQYRGLISTIKKRLSKGEKRHKVVKDELLRYWKTKGIKSSATKALQNVKSSGIFEVEEDMIITEGGNIFDGAGDIHKTEVEPTVKSLEDKLKINNLMQSMTGSSGKKEFSGDLDIVVPIDPTDDSAVKQFTLQCKTVFGPDKVSSTKQRISVLAQIMNYNETLGGDRTRTGYIQVDFFFGDKEWLQTFYHSPGEGESKFKGAHRNVAISSVAAEVERTESDERDSFDRPTAVVRWKWSPTDGLIKITRSSHKNIKGDKWVKTRKDTTMGQSYRDPKDIVRILFNGKVGPEALNSVESIIEAVNLTFDDKTAENIFHRMAMGFSTISRGVEYEYPPEIDRHMEHTN